MRRPCRAAWPIASSACKTPGTACCPDPQEGQPSNNFKSAALVGALPGIIHVETDIAERWIKRAGPLIPRR